MGLGVLLALGNQTDFRPFAYSRAHEGRFVAAGLAGHSHVLYARSPGGALSSARRVARYRQTVEAAAKAGGVDPDLLEAMVFVESAGLPDVTASRDLGGRAGLTQIDATTATQVLGMKVDVPASRAIGERIRQAVHRRQPRLVARLRAKRRRIDERFDPTKALRAAARYLSIALARFHRADFAVASYHLGTGELESAIRAYANTAATRPTGQVVEAGHLTYPRLYFDISPFRHRAAYQRLAALGESSSTYYWRVLAAREIMHLYRSRRAELARRQRLQTASGSAEQWLWPPGSTPVFADQTALRRARSDGQVIPVPSPTRQLFFAIDPESDLVSRRLGRDPRPYRCLRPEALAVLEYMADRVHAISPSGSAPLRVTAMSRDVAYQRLLASRGLAQMRGYSLYTTGLSFDIRRSYSSRAQARAFQYLLDRLQSLNVIAWERLPGAIHITVSRAGSSVVPLLHGRLLAPDA